MKKLVKYEFFFMAMSYLPLAIFFPFPIDLIPLSIQIICFIIFYKIVV